MPYLTVNYCHDHDRQEYSEYGIDQVSLEDKFLRFKLSVSQTSIFKLLLLFLVATSNMKAIPSALARSVFTAITMYLT